MTPRNRFEWCWLLVVALVASPATAFARPALGFEGGVNLGQLEYLNLTSDVGDQKWTWGGSAGAVAEWAMSPGWRLAVAPGWEHAARREDVSLFGFPPGRFDVHFDRVVIPIRVARALGSSGWSVDGSAGGAWLARATAEMRFPEFALATASPGIAESRGTRRTDAAIFEGLSSNVQSDVTRNYHRWDGFLSAAIGYERPVGSMRLRGRAGWQQGLTRIDKLDGAEVRLAGATASVGLLW